MRPGRLARVRRPLLVLGVALAALPTGAALADATIGQVGGEPSVFCQGSVVLGDTKYVVPAGGGFIDSFSIEVPSGARNAQVQFLVLQPTGQGNYDVVGLTPVESLEGSGTQSFPAAIQVAGGEILGLWIPADVDTDFCARQVASGPGGVVVSTDVDPPSRGATIQLLGLPERLDLNESAHLLSGGSGSPPPPTSKDQCKNGGWRDDPQFKSQGDCVSFVATGGKNPPSGS
jgi:hypothetical protein